MTSRGDPPRRNDREVATDLATRPLARDFHLSIIIFIGILRRNYHVHNAPRLTIEASFRKNSQFRQLRVIRVVDRLLLLLRALPLPPPRRSREIFIRPPVIRGTSCPDSPGNGWCSFPVSPPRPRCGNVFSRFAAARFHSRYSCSAPPPPLRPRRGRRERERARSSI